MDKSARDFDETLALLQERGVLSESQAQALHLRKSALEHSIIREKQTTRMQRYEASSAEIIAAANFVDAEQSPLDENRITREIAESLGFDFIVIDPLKLDAKLITESFSHAYARANSLLPLKLVGDVLTIATSAFQNAGLLASVRSSQRLTCHFVAATKSDILRHINEIYSFKSSVRAAAIEQSSVQNPQTLLGNLEAFVSLRQVEDIDASDSHVVNAVDYLLNYALTQRASDIHIEAKREQSLVRLRIDGMLHTAYKLPVAVHAPIVSRLKMLARLDIAEKRRPQDGRIKIENAGKEIELRLSSMPVAFGEKIVIRLLDSAQFSIKLENLGMEANELAIYKNFIQQTTGLILVTGPTGSGKTTTLYSSLKAISKPSLNITTIEDPIEIINEDFNQVQVHNKIGLDFHSALRTVLRQDPDVIMVGEIRDEETAHMAVQAALTGHLVLSTLHTNDAASAVTRLLDLGVKSFLLSSALLGVVAQRLVRCNCSACVQNISLSPEDRAALNLRQSAHDKRDLVVKVGLGCPRCRQSGIYGQSAIFELMPVSTSLRKLIHDAAPADALRRCALADSMVSLRENAIRKLADGIIPFSEVVRVLGHES
ncbi:MAG: GspE/PulE family protein [Bradymonadales bacterium]|jgi:general secretion pathway protein E